MMKEIWQYGVFLCVMTMTLPVFALSADKKPTTMAELALYKGADRQQILEAGAKKEGKLTFYTTGILKQAVSPVVNAFEKKYPYIKVEIWRASAGPLISKIVEEFKSGKHVVDAMEVTQTNIQIAREVGIIQNFSSPNFSQMDEESIMPAPDGGAFAVAFRTTGIGLGYNTKILNSEQVPKTYQDLLDPKWKGKMAICNDTGVNWAGCIYHTIGEEFLKKLAQQDFVVHMVSGQALLDMIINGEYALSPTIYDSHVYGSRKLGAPVAWVPLEPVRVSIGQIALAKHSPNPHAALLFADFELSKESGELHKSVGYGSFRKDISPLGRPFKKYFGTYTAADIKAEYELFNKLFVKK